MTISPVPTFLYQAASSSRLIGMSFVCLMKVDSYRLYAMFRLNHMGHYKCTSEARTSHIWVIFLQPGLLD